MKKAVSFAVIVTAVLMIFPFYTAPSGVAKSENRVFIHTTPDFRNESVEDVLNLIYDI